MRLKARDLIASVLVAAIAVPYAGFLDYGDMPFVEEPRAMAGVGLILGCIAYLVMEHGDPFDRADQVERSLAVGSLALGVAALALAETAAAHVLLACFMGSILVVWTVKMMDHAGVLEVEHTISRT